MTLPLEDFSTALRVLQAGLATPRELAKTFQAQASAPQRRTIAELLQAERGFDPGPLPAVQDPAAIAGGLRELGELLLAGDLVSEHDLDRAAEQLFARPHPKQLPPVPFPKGVDRYDLEWEVGRGREGAVYRAMREGDPPIAALKVFRKEAFATDEDRAAFVVRMVESVGKPRPGFVRVLEGGEASGQAWVALEFIEGKPLSALIAERKLGLRVGLEVLEKAARALGGLHAEGKVHGSLGATSILVTPDDRPHIADPGTGRGSPADDVAALGAILYELATGQPPYSGWRRDELKPPSSVNGAAAGGVERAIFKALAVDPTRRYRDAGELADDLARILRHEDVRADVRATETRRAVATAPKKSRLPLVAGAVAALLLVAVAAWSLTRPKDGPKPGPASGGGPARPTPTTGPVATRAPRSAPPRSDPEREAIAARGPMKRSEELDLRGKCAGALSERDFPRLEKLADEALLRGPERDWAHLFMAYCTRERGDLGAALEHATRAKDLGCEDPDLPRLRRDLVLLRGEYRRYLGELDAAFPRGVPQVNDEIRKLSEAIVAEPRDARLHVERGALFHHRQLYSRAIEDFAAAASLGDSRSRYFLALALWAEERPAEALEALKQFLAAHGSGPAGDEARATLTGWEAGGK